MAYGAKYLWDFGDGNTSTEEAPLHIYENPGTYTVTLTVTIDGEKVTKTKLNYVEVANVSNDYTYYGTFEVRNGYDGDIGIPGYIPTVPLIQIPNAGLQDSYYANFIRNLGGTESSPAVGAGDPTFTAGDGSARPMEVGTTNSFTTNSYGFYSTPFYFAVKPGDDLWITAADFPGYGQESTLTVEVGPYGGFREAYNITIGSQPYEPITFSVTRTA